MTDQLKQKILQKFEQGGGDSSKYIALVNGCSVMRLLFTLILTSVLNTDASSTPGRPPYLQCSPNYEERLGIRFRWTSSADLHLITVFHSTEGYINGTIITDPSRSDVITVFLETGKCGRDYNVTITGVNKHGQGPATWRACQTELENPSLSKVEKNDMTATVLWNNNCNTRHDIVIVDQNNFARRFNDTSPPYHFTMTPNMLYYVEVVAVYETGEGRSSKKYFSSGWPVAITSVSTISRTLHSIFLRWQEVEYADLYHIEVTSYSDKTVVAKMNIRNTEFNVTELKAGRRYEFKIHGKNNLGDGITYSTYIYTGSDIPFISSYSIKPDGTAKIEWTSAENNQIYFLTISHQLGTRVYSGVVNNVAYSWNLLPSNQSNLHAYVSTRDYYYDQTSNYFWFGNDVLRPRINEVSQPSTSQLLINASIFKGPSSYNIRIDSYHRINGIPSLFNRRFTKHTQQPFLCNIYSSSGKMLKHYITIFVDMDGDGSDEKSSDTFSYQTEPPKSSPSLVQTQSDSNSVQIRWKQTGYVERFWLFTSLVDELDNGVNTTTTSTYHTIPRLKSGHRYIVTVAGENPAGRGPSSNLTVKTDMVRPAVNDVVQQSGYVARIEWSQAKDAPRHIMHISNNGSVEMVNVRPGRAILYPLRGNLKLEIRVIALYEVGNSSTTYTFQGGCENSSCAGNSSCVLDEDNNQICSCLDNFRGNGRVACYPFCPAQKLNGYTFMQSPVGKLIFSTEKCPSGRPNASAICEIRKIGDKYHGAFSNSSLNSADCHLKMSNVTLKADAMSIVEVQNLCKEFQIVTANASLIGEENARKFIEFYNLFLESEVKISAQGVRDCLLAASQLTDYFRKHRNIAQQQILLQSIPVMLRRVQPWHYSQRLYEYVWTSENIFGKVLDVPVRLAHNEENGTFTITPEFLSKSGTGALDNSIELDVPYKAVISAHKTLTQNAECNRTTIRVVFLTFRDSTLFPKRYKSHWISFVDIGWKRKLTSNLSRPVLLRKQDRKSKTVLLSEAIYCGVLNLSEFYWSKNGCTTDFKSQTCAFYTSGYCGIFQNEVSELHAVFKIHYYDVAGCTAVVVAYIYTMISLLLKPSLRKLHKIQGLIQILATLSACHIVFMTAVDKTSSLDSCALVASLLHYLLLCSWFWASVFVYVLYRQLVKTDERISSKVAIIGHILIYVLPLIISAVVGSITWTNIASSDDGLARQQPNVCFIQNYALYFGLILPVGVLAVWITYVCILACRFLKKKGAGLRAEIFSSFAFIFIILLSWTACVSATLTSNTIPSWIFFSLNIFQAVRLAFGTCYNSWKEDAEQIENSNTAGISNEGTEYTMYEIPIARNTAMQHESPYDDIGV